MTGEKSRWNSHTYVIYEVWNHVKAQIKREKMKEMEKKSWKPMGVPRGLAPYPHMYELRREGKREVRKV